MNFDDYEPVPGFEFDPNDPNKTILFRPKLTELEKQGEALFAAARAGDLPQVKEMLAANPDFLNWRDRGGKAAIHAAVKAPTTEVAEYLIGQGSDVNVQSKGGKETPLMTAMRTACRTGDTDMLRLVVRRTNADLSPADHMGLTARGIAETLGKPDIVALIDELYCCRMDSVAGDGYRRGIDHSVRVRRPLVLKK